MALLQRLGRTLPSPLWATLTRRPVPPYPATRGACVTHQQQRSLRQPPPPPLSTAASPPPPSRASPSPPPSPPSSRGCRPPSA
ncbi:hypothetical protein BU14_0459s0017 [Porphyra umbilicalis]|uniref:Uncharacterized protein n=1 Tax=Porphyra umbilicalis TaxID=2786 RepID=A0A1X6NUL4_PORUM|nr:hypothetical protein BU14_0459s0017 [Porphyra umbilicalis]|eukprot:OSX72196.1 hypothetical protein BU14_0459s0017 [Porphyra umbilicalis]